MGKAATKSGDQSRASNDADKGSRGRGKGKWKGKGKQDSIGKSAGARDGDAAATETIIQQLRSKPRWCTARLKGLCPKGDSCPFPHIDEDSVARTKAAETSKRTFKKEPDKGTERGRAPSRDKKGPRWRKGSAGSE